MQLQVFYEQREGHRQRQLLLLPYQNGAATIPDHLQHVIWRHVAITTLADRLLARAGPITDAELGLNGSALLDLAAEGTT